MAQVRAIPLWDAASGRKDTSSLNTHRSPRASSPNPGWGVGDALPGPAGLLGAPAWPGPTAPGLSECRCRPPRQGASGHPRHPGSGGGAEVWTPALPCRGWFRPAVPWSDWVANLDRLKTSAQVTADGWSWRDERRRAGSCAREPRNPRSRRHLGCSGGRRDARPRPGLTSAGRTPPVRRGVPRGQPTRHRRGAGAPCRPAGELQSGPPAPSGRHSVVPAGAAVPTSGHTRKLPLRSPSCTTEHNLPRRVTDLRRLTLAPRCSRNKHQGLSWWPSG